jgi:dihydropteroate synthase
MGILNVTPDSFSDGGSYVSVEAAVEQARRLVEAGADVLDIGGESTRPGANPVGVEEELRRVVPVVAELASRISVPISVDTTKAAVAAAALKAGAEIVNDVSGLTFDPEMPAVCRDHSAGVVCMHIKGTPQTMQLDPRYDDVVGEVERYFLERLDALEAAGIPPERVVLDPGIGFGKTAAHNVDLLAATDRLRRLGRPLLVGHSRKRFLKAVLGRPVEERTAGTIGVAVALAGLGVDYLRVHDVQAVRDALVAWKAVTERQIEASSRSFEAGRGEL